MEYKHRIADQMLSKKLASKGAILIEGPEWCGKTTTAEQQANSILYMDNPASLDTNLQMAEIDASVLLDGETPRLIDEWQLAPPATICATAEACRSQNHDCIIPLSFLFVNSFRDTLLS